MSNNPQKIDPWEAREKEREYFRNPRQARRNTTPQEDIWSETHFNLRDNFVLVGLLLAHGLLLVSGVGTLSDDFRYLLMQIGTFLALLLTGAAVAFQESIFPALRRGPTLWILLLLAWTVYSFLTAPYADKGFAATELLRIFAGAATYFLAAYTLKSPRQLSLAVAGLLLLGSLVSLYDLAQTGQRGGLTSLNTQSSVLGTHEHLGSLLALLLPLALSFAVHPDTEEKRKLAAVAITLVLGAALLSSRSRSGWLATILALVVLAVLFSGYILTKKRETETRQAGLRSLLTSPIFQVAIALIVFVGITGLAPWISQRGAELQARDNGSVRGRLILWQGAGLMATEKPITGWGLGTFPIFESQFTHVGEDTVFVLLNGSNHENNAHNYYLQTLAETGGIGLALHLTVLGAFVFSMLIFLARLQKSGKGTARVAFQMTLIAASVATVTAALFDSIASPMYQFPGIWTILYTVMGFGVAATRPIPRRGEDTTEPALAKLPLWIAPVAFVVGVSVPVTLLFLAGHARNVAIKNKERGQLEIVAQPIGPITPGKSLYFKAIFTDENGQEQQTMPGTVWNLEAPPEILNRAEVELLQPKDGEKMEGMGELALHTLSTPKSYLRVLVRETATTANTIKATAKYRDRLGRLYTTTVIKTVETSRPEPGR